MVSDNNPDMLDAKLVSISAQTDRSDLAYAEVMQALGILGPKFKKTLYESGVRLIITPQISDILMDLGLDEDSYNEYLKYSKSWPTLFAPELKIIYIGEQWEGYRGNSVTYSVLNRCGFAYQMLTNLGGSADLREAIKSDYDQVPADVLPQNIDRPPEFWAALFAAVTMTDHKPETSGWFVGMTYVFSQTSAFVRNKIELIENG